MCIRTHMYMSIRVHIDINNMHVQKKAHIKKMFTCDTSIICICMYMYT